MGYTTKPCFDLFCLVLFLRLFKFYEWIVKLWQMCTMECLTELVKKGGTMGFAGKWMEMEDTILSEVTRARKDK